MDFELTDEQRLIQETVRSFVDERVLPVAVQNDIDHRLDLELIEGMAELGILGIVIPEEYGGAGLDFVAEALSCEEIERGEAAFRTLISVHVGLNSLSLLKYASEEQKQRWLTPQAKGEKLACFGLTEPGAGSDVASMRSTARREGDVYVLNGQKNWISYATVADHALVFAKTDPQAAHKGISAFVLEKGMKGFTSADTENKLGIWAGSTGELFFENVEVPAENLIGAEGQGFEIAMHSLDQGRFTVAAGACGVVRACLERSVEYARERETFGQEIGKYQFVQDMIAKMVLGYETSKLLVMQAAWMKNEGKRNTRETSLAKWHATESAFEAAHLAIQVFGSYGYSGEYGIERYFRNARAPIIYEGTTQIHKMMQAEHALGYRKLNGRNGDVSPLCSWAPALSAVHATA
jgi:glutaryl-CoA dehydrogenase (non-decarboxylating)